MSRANYSLLADADGLEAQRGEIRRVAEAYWLEIGQWVERQGASGIAVLTRLADAGASAVVVAALDRILRPENLSGYVIRVAARGAGGDWLPTVVKCPTERLRAGGARPVWGYAWPEAAAG